MLDNLQSMLLRFAELFIQSFALNLLYEAVMVQYHNIVMTYNISKTVLDRATEPTERVLSGQLWTALYSAVWTLYRAVTELHRAVTELHRAVTELHRAVTELDGGSQRLNRIIRTLLDSYSQNTKNAKTKVKFKVTTTLACTLLTKKNIELTKLDKNAKIYRLKKELEKEERRGETCQIVKNAKNFEGKEEGRKLEGEDQIEKKKREKLTKWSKMRKLLGGRRRERARRRGSDRKEEKRKTYQTGKNAKIKGRRKTISEN
ncbi:hypothetical protein EDB19DRAFT_1950833 [Suillus lakei]|nr:hypothetical protein EDB19DRAFT_1950833 [Suillus lakei]